MTNLDYAENKEEEEEAILQLLVATAMYFSVIIPYHDNWEHMSGFKALINQIELLIRRLTNLDCYLGVRDGIMISSLRGPNMKIKK